MLDISLPFIAYGLFNPGQICFLQVKDFVVDATNVRISGMLRLRDGLVLYVPDGHGQTIQGSVLRFHSGEGGTAYALIEKLEPESQYRWNQVSIDGQQADILVDKSPNNGSDPCDGDDYDGWQGPLFKSALDVVRETLDANEKFEWDLKPLFRLQMAYLLLWASIERYSTLRYGLAKKPEEGIKLIGNEPHFKQAIEKFVTGTRRVQRADRPQDGSVLSADNPKKSIEYYHQVRCNSIHRGKANESRDHEIVRKSLQELLPVFSGMLDACRAEAKWLGHRPNHGETILPGQ